MITAARIAIALGLFLGLCYTAGIEYVRQPRDIWEHLERIWGGFRFIYAVLLLLCWGILIFTIIVECAIFVSTGNLFFGPSGWVTL